MHKDVARVDALAESEALDFCGDNSKRRRESRRYREAEVLSLVVLYSNGSTTRHKRKPSELLVELEAENAALRHRAVELELQIRALRESRFRLRRS